MAKKPIPSIHVPIQTENGSMELAWYLYLKSTSEGGGGSTTVDWDDITNKPSFATVATSGSYTDLSNKPTIPAAQVNSDWNANSGVAQILNKPTIPDDSDLVHKTGDETITGLKTIEQTNTTVVYSQALILKGGNLDKDINPSTNHFNSIDFIDKDNIIICKFSAIQTSDGWSGFLAGCGNDPTNPQNNLLMIASGSSKLLLIPPTSSHTSSAVRRDFFNTEIAKKQDTLVSGTNIKTINNNSLLGSGNMTIDYNDLDNKPTIPSAQVNSDWNASSGVAEILNKPTLGTMAAESANDYTKTSGLAAVATSGSYSDLSNKPTIPAAQVNSDWNANSGVAEILNKPTIPTVNDATITFTQGGVTKGTITTNQSSASTIALDAGGGATVPQSIDASIVGSLTISNADVSGFSNSNYLVLPGVFVLNDASSFEIKIAFTTKSNPYGNFYLVVSSKYSVYATGICLYVLGGKLKLTVASSGGYQEGNGNSYFSASTKYYIKISYNGSYYTVERSTDDVNYTQEISMTVAHLPVSDILYLAQGSECVNVLHMDSCYIKKNGIIIWQGMDAPGLHQRVTVGHEVIEFQAPTSTNNYTWYRKYADGWVEQGGLDNGTTRGGTSDKRVNIPVEMADANYYVNCQKTSAWDGAALSIQVGARDTTGFNWSITYSSSAQNRDICWEVKGMAQG